MMSSTDPMRPEGEKLAQHANWAERHARLVRGPAPAPKPQLPRPVSPFLREARERREQEAQERADAAARCLSNVAPLDAPRWKKIIYEVAQKHGVKCEEIIGPLRSKWITVPRHEVMFRLFCETRMSTVEIGRRVGGRDHSTALHSLRWMSRNVPGAKDALEAATARRAAETQAEKDRLVQEARKLCAAGKTPKQILGMLPISEVALYKALARPVKVVNQEAANGEV